MAKGSRRPATTPEKRENQLIDLAYSVVEDRLRSGEVTDSLLAQIFRMGSTRERLEKENLKARNKLANAKTKHIESSEHIEALYTEAMEMLRRYSGAVEEEDVE